MKAIDDSTGWPGPWCYESQRNGTYIRHRPGCPWAERATLAAVPPVAKGRREIDIWTCGVCLKGDG